MNKSIVSKIAKTTTKTSDNNTQSSSSLCR
jgi:hypothetical protein